MVIFASQALSPCIAVVVVNQYLAAEGTESEVRLIGLKVQKRMFRNSAKYFRYLWVQFLTIVWIIKPSLNYFIFGQIGWQFYLLSGIARLKKSQF